jgi:hypothetical protein
MSSEAAPATRRRGTQPSEERVMPCRRIRTVLLMVLAAVAMLAPARAAVAQTLTATITYPANGTTNADMALPVQWTAVPGVQAYYLYVGTTAGAKDLVNTGEILQTSYLTANLPTGQTLYARMWTKVGNVWRFVDSTFIVTHAPIVTSTLTYPANHAASADMSQPFRWTTVANIQAYYLYVGTTLGAKDLVNTGETSATSYLAGNLPVGQTLYARMWTKVGGHWYYNDTTFVASVAGVVTATMTFPANGAVNANLSQPIQWTSVASAQAYYLYIGTTLGAKDLVNTGEIQTTSYLAANLPAGQTLYARLWTKAGNLWRYVDSTFTAAPSVPLSATITFPANGAVNADLSQPVQWTSVPNVQAYYLYIGTTVGAKDLVNTGEILTTSYVVSNVPANQVVYVRLWTKVGGVWRYNDTTFSAAVAAVVRATLTYPADGATDIDQLLPATWTSVPNAQKYYLYVGTTTGAKDLIDSGETTGTSWSIAGLPVGPILHARLWTKVAGIWRYNDTTFTASAFAPAFLYPTDGQLSVDGSQAFQWSAPTNADAHQLLVGTTPGGQEIFNSGVIAGTSAIVPGLPSTGTLYARVLSRVHGAWNHTDIAFTLEASTATSTMIVPEQGEAGFDTARPFEWQAVPMARGYRLTIGTTPGGNDLHDSGEIHVTQRFVPNLPLGALFGRLETKLDGQWYATDFTFSVGANSVSNVLQIKSALWATDVVRGMARTDNRAFSWTLLTGVTYPRFQSVCSDYAKALVAALTEMNVQLSFRVLNIALNPNHYDTHTLVEMLDPGSNRWMLLDPTFDLTATRSADDSWASAEDISAATRAQTWSDITYVFLGAAGDSYARAYYLDYPLLYVNVYHQGDPVIAGQGGPVLVYMNQVPLPVSGSHHIYAVGCTGDQTAPLRVDGSDVTFDCTGVDGLSQVFGASTIEATTGTPASVVIYQPRRYVF